MDTVAISTSNTGVIPSVEVVFMKTDPELIKALCKRTGQDEAHIKRLMRYNVWTVKQFSELSGRAISTISNLCRPFEEGGQFVFRLNHCFPFPGKSDQGPMFIYRNEKSEKYLRD